MDKKNKSAEPAPHKKVKTRGNVLIPGGLRDGLMGRSKEEFPNKENQRK